MPPVRLPSILALVILLSARPWAHLLPGSLTSPAAGATYEAGSTVSVSWTQSQAHAGTYRFEFSPDGGATWTETGSMRAPSGDGKVVTYGWTVPMQPAGKARFKVCQPGGPCSDPDYFLESGDFAVHAPSAVRPGPRYRGPDLRVLPGSGHMEVTLILDRPGRISLHALDARGISAPLLSETLSRPGEHRRRLPRRPGSMAAFLVLHSETGRRAIPVPKQPQSP